MTTPAPGQALPVDAVARQFPSTGLAVTPEPVARPNVARESGAEVCLSYEQRAAELKYRMFHSGRYPGEEIDDPVPRPRD